MTEKVKPKQRPPLAILSLMNYTQPGGKKVLRWELISDADGKVLDHANSEMEIYDRNRDKYVIEKSPGS